MKALRHLEMPSFGELETTLYGSEMHVSRASDHPEPNRPTYTSAYEVTGEPLGIAEVVGDTARLVRIPGPQGPPFNPPPVCVSRIPHLICS